MARPANSAVTDAQAVIAGKEIDSVSAIALARTLMRDLRFGYARRMLATVRARAALSGEALPLVIGQQQAVCTYKDLDLSAERRLERGLAILAEVSDPDAPDADQETLGIAGAIWKRRWELSTREQDLEQSLDYYERSAALGMGDGGYSAVNAAFVLDLLAAQMAKLSKGTRAESIAGLQSRARAYRNGVIAFLQEKQSDMEATAWQEWWLPATMAEALVGNGKANEAHMVLERALTQRSDSVSDWELESTARQLATLIGLHDDHPALWPDYADGAGVVALLVAAARDDLQDATSSAPTAGRVSARDVVQSLSMGKTGLALSGGGFRASLFHIGVLARLAELDLLRHIEVISCVSGGSIIGAHYYLKLKLLLESQPDDSITRDDYIRLVDELVVDFVTGVQTNVRMRLFAEFVTNLRMVFEPGFTRTKRAGELYESEIYSRMAGTGEKTMEREWCMPDLLVQPSGERAGFRPLLHNWRRRAKVPALVLNATTLNTGHNWQFTASWMGEPPSSVEGDVDGNYRLRRLYYDQSPEPYKSAKPVRLGHAVGASSAVPGLFDPVELSQLYERIVPGSAEPKPITVRLVDGGVHDNQGTASLADQGCSVQLVSDASGQMSSIDEPSQGPIGVLLRTTSVQGARIRTAEYDDLSARRSSGALRRLLFVHLKRGLGVEHIDWRGCNEPHHLYGEHVPTGVAGGPSDPSTSYGIPKEAQRLLAEVRTDLDSFTDGEAYALMVSGYNMTREEAQSCGFRDLVPTAVTHRWKFQSIEPALTEVPAVSNEAKNLRKLLATSSVMAFKIVRLNAMLRTLAMIAGFAVSAWLVVFLWTSRAAHIPMPRVTTGAIALVAALALAVAVGGPLVKRVLEVVQYRKTLRQVLGGVALALGAFLIARLHLIIFDRMYLRWGKISRFIHTT